MLVVGLTGSLGSGKSTVAAMFGQLGATIIDADRIAYKITQPNGECFKRVVKQFGRNILSQGYIDRQKLAAIVFKNHRRLRQLEKIIHPVVRQKIHQEIEQKERRGQKKIVVVEVPLLFESGINQDVDVTMVVHATSQQQIKRAVYHKKITKAEAKRRIQCQMPLKDKIRLADIIIENNQTKTKTKKQVKRIWQRLLIRKNK